MKIILTKDELEIWDSLDCRNTHCSACPFNMNNGSDNNCFVSLVKFNFPKAEISTCDGGCADA